MPDNVRNLEMFFGLVVSVGSRVLDARTKLEARVCYGPYAGKTVVMEGIEFRLLREGQIEGYIVRKSSQKTDPIPADASGDL